jgi:hypothetical protein
MKTFELTIFKGHDTKQVKTVLVSSQLELNNERNAFWMESAYKKGVSKNWMGTKRVK